MPSQTYTKEDLPLLRRSWKQARKMKKNFIFGEEIVAFGIKFENLGDNCGKNGKYI